MVHSRMCMLLLFLSFFILHILHSSFFLKEWNPKVRKSSAWHRRDEHHHNNAIVLRSGWTSRGFSLTSKKEAVTYGSSFYAANPKRKRRTPPRPSRSRPPKVITRLMMALWKNAQMERRTCDLKFRGTEKELKVRLFWWSSKNIRLERETAFCLGFLRFYFYRKKKTA